MRRTTIYLPDEQLDTLRVLADQRGESVAELVRQAVDGWLAGQGVRLIGDDEWAQRFESLLTRRRRVAKGKCWSPEEIERDVSGPSPRCERRAVHAVADTNVRV